MKRYLFAFVLALGGGAAALGFERLFFNNSSNDVASITTNVPGQFAALGGGKLPDFTPAAEQTVHAVVHVMTKFTTTQTYFDPFQGMFGGNGMQTIPQEQQASGSGVIISKDGYIVTNYHVIQQAEQIQVTLNDKRAYDATLVGADPNTDLAVLKIDEEGLPFIAWGNSDDVKIGEWVLAVGNPFNLTSTVTAGIVSAKARNINIISGNGSGSGAVESFIQTDAAVNPGNSGGALVNTNGQLVGINTAIASQNGSFTGYSFAVPVNLVKKIVTDLIEFGMVQRGYLGVNIQDVDANLAKNKNLDKVSGVYVIGVMKNGAAEDAKLREGDVITAIDKVNVANVAELQEQVNRHRPGDKVEVTYIRKGEEQKVTATLKNKNNTTEIIRKDEGIKAVESLGATFEQMDQEELKRLGINAGLRVSKLDDGKLRTSGMKEGFIITAVDKVPVGTPEELKDILENKKGGILIEGVYPNGTRAYYALGL
jgi:S1-C subfamily serine protease